MPAPRELTRLEHLLDSTSYILNKVRGADISIIAHDLDTRAAIFYHLIIIGEAANNISEGVRSQYPQVPWREVVGLRNVMAHEYFGVDFDSVWLIISEDLPRLASTVRQMIANYPKED